jgi:signal transduction histidine kinase
MAGYLFAAACAGLLCACYGAGLAALSPRWTAAIAAAIRSSVTERHEVLGVLRSERARGPGISAVGALIEEYRAAGAVVSTRPQGTPRPLPPQVDEAAYRVIEEGLTNAIRHAPGQHVSVTIAWAPNRLLLTVANPANRRDYVAGSGLTDLDERLRQAGGNLGHEVVGGQFRLRAALPAAPTAGTTRRPRVAVLGMAVGAAARLTTTRTALPW